MNLPELEAAKLEQGGIYVVRPKQKLPPDLVSHLRDYLTAAGQSAGVKFVLFDAHLDILPAADLRAVVSELVRENNSCK